MRRIATVRGVLGRPAVIAARGEKVRPLQWLSSGALRSSPASAPTRFAVLPVLTQQRDYKAPVSDIKKGWVIEHLGKLWEVTDVSQSRKTAMRRAHINMELRDLAAGTKKSERFRVEDRIETIILDVQKCIFSRVEGKKLIFTNAETGEAVSVRKDLAGPAEFYLKPGSSTARLSIHNGEAITARLPTKAVVTIKEADSTQSATPGYKKAILDNGRSIRVPNFLGTGDAIVISLPEEEYLGKSGSVDLDDDEEVDDEEESEESEEETSESEDEDDDEEEEEEDKKKK